MVAHLAIRKLQHRLLAKYVKKASQQRTAARHELLALCGCRITPTELDGLPIDRTHLGNSTPVPRQAPESCTRC